MPRKGEPERKAIHLARDSATLRLCCVRVRVLPVATWKRKRRHNYAIKPPIKDIFIDSPELILGCLLLIPLSRPQPTPPPRCWPLYSPSPSASACWCTRIEDSGRSSAPPSTPPTWSFIWAMGVWVSFSAIWGESGVELSGSRATESSS